MIQDFWTQGFLSSMALTPDPLEEISADQLYPNLTGAGVLLYFWGKCKENGNHLAMSGLQPLLHRIIMEPDMIP